MDIRYAFEYLVVNAFWIYILVRFTFIFFNESMVNKTKRAVICLLFYLINSLGYLLFFSPIVNIFTSIIGIFALTICYQSSMIKRVVATLLIYIISMTCDIGITILVSRYVIGMKVGVENNVLMYLLIFIIELLLEHSVRLKHEFNPFKRFFWVLLTIPVCSIFIIYILVFYLKGMHNISFIIVGLLLFMNIIIFYLYDSLLQSYIEKYKNFVLEQQLYAYRNQLETNMQSQNIIRGIKHDIKHHLLALENMIGYAAEDEINSYLEDMMGSIENPKEYSSTGNKDIDSILNYFIQQAVDKGIKIEAKINIAEKLKVKFFELNVILSNLLDNAIRASEQSQGKEILIDVELDREILYINIENSYNGILKKHNGKLVTTKQNSEEHGYGLKNVGIMIEKYQGSLKIDYTEKRFTVGVLLYLENISEK